MSERQYKTARRLQEGDRIFRTPPTSNGARRIYVVDHTTDLPYGIVRIWFGHLGLQSIDAAAAHRFEIAPEHTFDLAKEQIQ